MKKTIKSLVAVCMLTAVCAMTSYGQNYQKGDKLLNVGIGLGGGVAPSGAKGIPPVGLSFEVGATDKISVGGYAGYSSAKQTIAGWGGNWEYSYQYILVGARGSYHFDFGVDKLDPYVGAVLGYNIASAKVTGAPAGTPTASAGGFLWGGHAGARYMFSEKIGAFGELGYGISYLTVGLAFKL